MDQSKLLLEKFSSGADFLCATRWLFDAEEVNATLIYGLALQIATHPERFPQPPYLAVVRDPLASGDKSLLVAFLMTPPRGIVLLCADRQVEGCTAVCKEQAFDLVIKDLRANAHTVPNVFGRSDDALAFARAWQRWTLESFKVDMVDSLYALHEVIFPERRAPGHMRTATSDDVELILGWLILFVREALPSQAELQTEAALREQVCNRITDGTFMLWVADDEQCVALAGITGRTPHVSRIGPVFTPKEQRCKGYASILTATLAHSILTAEPLPGMWEGVWMMSH